MKLGIDYNYVEKESSKFYSLKLLRGKWSGVIFTFGTVSVKEDIESDTAYLTYDFKIEDVSGTKFEIKVLEEDVDFKKYIGDLLVSILESNIKED